MRNRSFATLGTLALLAAASAFGQQRLPFDVPFAFSFADKVMPAGQYDVTLGANNTRGLLLVDCHACQTRAIDLTRNVGGGPNARTEGRLVFHKYGDTYFLSEVWLPGSRTGSGLYKSKTERELARTTAKTARITPPAQTSVVILARR
jgi:hypothetical protein